MKNQYSLLIVEDDPITLALMYDALESDVSELYTAENGQVALDIYHEHHPKIVLTDISMPVMDGIKLIKELRNIDPNLPIGVCTAYSEELRLLDYDLPVLEKPVSVGALQSIIKTLFES